MRLLPLSVLASVWDKRTGIVIDGPVGRAHLKSMGLSTHALSEIDNGRLVLPSIDIGIVGAVFMDSECQIMGLIQYSVSDEKTALATIEFRMAVGVAARLYVHIEAEYRRIMHGKGWTAQSWDLAPVFHFTNTRKGMTAEYTGTCYPMLPPDVVTAWEARIRSISERRNASGARYASRE